MTFGYAKDFYYTSDSTMQIRVRIPSIHGPYRQQDAGGKTLHNYVQDTDLPYYPSIILPQVPKDGDVVVLSSINNSEVKPEFMVIGLTGASYTSGADM